MKKTLEFATRVIHGGQKPDPLTGAVMPPIYATSTYVQSSPGVHKGYEYSRTANPTRDALQASLANLEGGQAAFAFASGMAATGTVLALLDHGPGRDVRRSHLSRCVRGGDSSEHQDGVGGDADQSAAQAGGSGRRGADC